MNLGLTQNFIEEENEGKGSECKSLIRNERVDNIILPFNLKTDHQLIQLHYIVHFIRVWKVHK